MTDAKLLRKYTGIPKDITQYVSELADNKKLKKKGIYL